MRSPVRIIAAIAAAVLVAIGLSSSAEAARNDKVTVTNGSSYEYFKTCNDVAPYTCGTFNTTLYFEILLPWPQVGPVTFGYEILNGTAVAGQDFTGPTTGTATVAGNTNFAFIPVPVVNDGVTEPSETLTLRLTSSSRSRLDISDTGLGTIQDAGAIPADCDLSRPNQATFHMTCTNRPAGQRWLHEVTCGEDWLTMFARGNTVTGNGTSTTNCPRSPYGGSRFIIVP